MIREICSIAINGRPQADLVPDIFEVEVEEHVDAADVFRVRVAVAVKNDGTWTHLDDDRFVVWNRLSIVAGYPDDNDTIIDGYITHIHAYLSATGAEDMYIEVAGMDASALMDLEEKQLAWPNKKDSEIAQQIFSSFGLSSVVEDTTLVHDERVATILQSESDIRFLRRLAARNGFECFIQGGKGFFRSPNFQDPPQKVLAIQFGQETNLSSLQLYVDGTPPTSLEIRRIDPVAKQENREKLGNVPRRRIGARTLNDLRASLPDGKRLIKQRPAAGTEEMQGELRAGYEAAGEFVTVSGEIDSRAYRAVLRAKKLVTIKGAGATYSGLYYVTRARHLFTNEQYIQSFEGYRNGVGLTGAERFAAPSSLLPIATGAATASVPTGNRVLPVRQRSSSIPGGS